MLSAFYSSTLCQNPRIPLLITQNTPQIGYFSDIKFDMI